MLEVYHSSTLLYIALGLRSILLKIRLESGLNLLVEVNSGS